MRCPAAAAFLALALTGASCPSGGNMPAGDKAAAVPPARDGNIAIAQELDAARKARTVEAYDLFIARHPHHPLAQVARTERERLLRGARR
ncbi:MAG: hypothetical protein M3177_10325 [Pseudomonadota bacterium]|nr:hypothetical protein [Pseudomonadota bacterium]